MGTILRNDIILKILSFVCATALWLYVVYAENPIIETWLYSVPVEFLNADRLEAVDVVLLTDIVDKTVDIKLRGRRRSIAEIRPGDVIASADLAQITTGDRFALPIITNVRVNDVEVTERRPASHTLETDKIVELTKNVNIVTKNDPARGYVTTQSTVSPSTVRVKGPSQTISDIQIFTEPMDLGGATRDISGDYKLLLKNSAGDVFEDIEISENTVKVVCELSLVKSVPVELMVTDSSNTKTAELITTSVEVIGEGEIVEKLEFISTESLDISYETDQQEIFVPLILPNGVSIYKGSTDALIVVKTIIVPSPSPEAVGLQQDDSP